jgi:hypothetical protein
MRRVVLCTIAAALLAAGPAAAQPRVAVSFDNGIVTMTANGARAADLLAEWARVGGTAMSGLELLADTRLTLSLTDVSERVALDALIVAPAGYVTSLKNEVGPGTSTLRSLQIVMASKDRATRTSSRPIDTTIPESIFSFPAPAVEDPEQLSVKPEDYRERPPSAPDPGMPEMRFQFPEPASFPVEAPPAEEEKPAPAAKPAPKKPLPGR